MTATVRSHVRVSRPRLSGIAGALALVLLLVWPDPSWASRKMRCGNTLIGKGAYEEQVLARCGEPYASHGNYWLYRVRNVVFRVYFRRGQVSWIKREIVF